MTHTLADYGLMYVASFAMVFLLGLQSKNVIAGRYIAAIITSIGISTANFTFVKYAAAGTWQAFVVCAAGGAAGIAGSIWFYEHVLSRRFRFANEPRTVLSDKRDQPESYIHLTTDQLLKAIEGALERARNLSKRLEKT